MISRRMFFFGLCGLCELCVGLLETARNALHASPSASRLRRVDEFVRIQTLLRIEQETERTEKIKAEREFLVEQV